MSALLSLGEANHVILNADAEIGLALRKLHAIDHGIIDRAEEAAALTRAQQQLQKARAAISAVRLAIRTQAVWDAHQFHAQMANSLREGAFLQRVAHGRGLHVEADRHEKFAKALGALLGT